MLNKRKFYINGQWVDPIKPDDCNVINPSTEENCAVISIGSKEDDGNWDFEVYEVEAVVSLSVFSVLMFLDSSIEGKLST